MAVRAPGDYDPNTGWPPDDSTGVRWQDDVTLPGQFQGGGAGFGPGGFQGNPKLTAPASGPPPGISLSNGGASAAPPTNAVGMSPHIDPATGQPEMLTGPGGLVEKTRGSMNPFGFIGRGNPYWRGAIAAGGILSPTPAETGELTPAQLAHGPSDPKDLLPPAYRPEDDPRYTDNRTFPGWPTPPAPVAPAGRPGGIGSDANRPVMGAGGFPTTYANPGAQPAMPNPTPLIGSPAPAVPPVRPAHLRGAGPAAVRQQPNLGAYNPFITLPYRPNAPAEGGGRGGGGPPVATALDLSRLFSRQQ